MSIKIFLQLVRWNNLVLIALTQSLLYYFVLVSPLHQLSYSLNTTIPVFILISLMTITVAAAGYVVNDIYDQVIDQLNKPDKVIVGEKINETNAWKIYYILIALGLIIALVLSWSTSLIFWLGLYIFSTLMMFYYSKSLKRAPFVGNLVVAIFCGLTALIVSVNDLETLQMAYKAHPKIIQNTLFLFIGYTIFAFYTTLYREIVKDIEDANGDAFHNCRTLPIVLGINLTKIIAGGLALGLFVMTAYWSALLWTEHFWEFAYVVLAIAVPINMSIIMLYLAKNKDDFHRISQTIKLIMLSGLLYLVLQSFF